MFFQATSRIMWLHFTCRSCIILLHLQLSWDGQHWSTAIVVGKPWRMTSSIEYLATKGASSLHVHGVRSELFFTDQTHHDARSHLCGHGTINKAFHVGASDFGKDTPDLEFASRIHHPFLLSDNRHYTFYVWKRIFSLHPIVPYLLIPGYIVCAWIWFLRVGT
jgi:DIE2/ALG10 family